MEIPKDKVLELVRSRGDGDKADQADQKLPDQVDTERDWGCSRSSASIPRSCSAGSAEKDPRALIHDHEEKHMAEPVPSGSDVSAGTYRCTECGNELEVGSTQSLPPCPECGNGSWQTMSGGDSAADPYPER